MAGAGRGHCNGGEVRESFRESEGIVGASDRRLSFRCNGAEEGMTADSGTGGGHDGASFRPSGSGIDC